MAMQKEKYIPRLVDKKIKDYLEVFGAISIEGPKWCGKTWSALAHANSAVFLDDEETKAKALLNLEYIFLNKFPLLIDEWNMVPKIWDATFFRRRKKDHYTFWRRKNWENQDDADEFI